MLKLSTKIIILNDTLYGLPDFVYDFIKKYYNGESINTQIAYAIDIRVFLRYLLRTPSFAHISNIDDIKPQDMNSVDLNTLINFKDYLCEYNNTYESSSGKTISVILKNGKKGILRKLSTLRSLYDYLFKADLVICNITEKLDLPKVNHKIKPPLSFNETINIIDIIFNGEKYFKGKELSNYKTKRQRDISIFTTLLGTGIRVSELVGLNIDDINFEDSSFKVTRKGGDEQTIFMPIQVENEIFLYLKQRKLINSINSEEAMFLSNRGTRLTVSSIEKMIRKYCNTAGVMMNDKTTVHALRRTFACRLLEDGIDLKAVSELLGHKDISVTARFYAQHNKETHRRIMSKRNIPLPE